MEKSFGRPIRETSLKDGNFFGQSRQISDKSFGPRLKEDMNSFPIRKFFTQKDPLKMKKAVLKTQIKNSTTTKLFWLNPDCNLGIRNCKFFSKNLSSWRFFCWHVEFIFSYLAENLAPSLQKVLAPNQGVKQDDWVFSRKLDLISFEWFWTLSKPLSNFD